MNDVYYVWRNIKLDLKKHEVIDSLSEYHRIAVCLGNMNYQVENGGFSQWIFNGYALEDVEIIYNFIESALLHDKYKNNDDLKSLLKMLDVYHQDVKSFKDCDYIWVTCEECGGQGYYDDCEDDDDENCKCYSCNGEGEIRSKHFTRDYYAHASDRNSDLFYKVDWIAIFQQLVNDYELITINSKKQKEIK